MVKVLMSWRVWIFELGAAIAIVTGVNRLWGGGAALIAGGVCAYIKAYEWDLRGDSE